MVLKKTTKEFDLIPRDGRKKMFLTLDTETAGDVKKGNNLVYDFGFAIHDRMANIYYQRNFLIEEVFNDQKLMNSAYYADKIPLYIEKLRNNEIEKVPLKTALNFFQKCVNEYNVDTISAYNILFDVGAIKSTAKKYLPKIYGNFGNKDSFSFLECAVLKKPIEFICIYNYACQVLATQKTYARTAIKYNGILESNDWISKAKNIKTNAQCMQRYITGKYDFYESHTALNDVLIEIQILKKCFQQKKKFDKTIKSNPWKIPQNTFQEIFLKEGDNVK